MGTGTGGGGAKCDAMLNVVKTLKTVLYSVWSSHDGVH
jgi:hypothetical protein